MSFLGLPAIIAVDRLPGRRRPGRARAAARQQLVTSRAADRPPSVGRDEDPEQQVGEELRAGQDAGDHERQAQAGAGEAVAAGDAGADAADHLVAGVPAEPVERARSCRRPYGRAMELRAVRGDITEADVDVIVNAANPGLLGGGGRRRRDPPGGGPAVLAECRAIVARLPGAGCPAGRRWRRRPAGCPRAGSCTPPGRSGRRRRTTPPSCGPATRESLRVADGLGARTRGVPGDLGRHLRLADGRRRAAGGRRGAVASRRARARRCGSCCSPTTALAAFEAALSG